MVASIPMCCPVANWHVQGGNSLLVRYPETDLNNFLLQSLSAVKKEVDSPMLKRIFRRMSEPQTWGTGNFETAGSAEMVSSEESLVFTEVYKNSVPDSVPSAVAQDCCWISGYTGETYKIICCASFHILLNHTVKSFQAVQIKMRLQLNLKILQLRFWNDQLIFIRGICRLRDPSFR